MYAEWIGKPAVCVLHTCVYACMNEFGLNFKYPSQVHVLNSWSPASLCRFWRLWSLWKRVGGLGVGKWRWDLAGKSRSLWMVPASTSVPGLSLHSPTIRRRCCSHASLSQEAEAGRSQILSQNNQTNEKRKRKKEVLITSTYLPFPLCWSVCIRFYIPSSWSTSSTVYSCFFDRNHTGERNPCCEAFMDSTWFLYHFFLSSFFFYHFLRWWKPHCSIPSNGNLFFLQTELNGCFSSC